MLVPVPPAAQAAELPVWAQRIEGPSEPGLDELQCRWLGTAGFEIRTAKATILIDPFFTRISLWQLLLGPVRPDPEQIKPYLRPTAAIFVSHSHWDHLLDAPMATRLSGATLYGSAETLQVARAEGLPASQMSLLEGHGVVTVGDVTIEAIPSVHSRIPTQMFVGGKLPPTVSLPMGFLSYKHGPVYGFLIRWRGRTLYHCGSADFSDREVAGTKVDVLLQCLAGWKNSPHLWERLRDRLQPQVVVPMHHDDFFRPLSEGYHEVMFANVAEALAGIRQAMPDATILQVPLLQSFRVWAAEGVPLPAANPGP
jgi:L-ascorbate metabolism protein UlaG (beta-lactamase superfamily)